MSQDPAVKVHVAPVLQAAFDRERNAARTQNALDGVATRLQTVRMYGRLADLQRQTVEANNVALACTLGCNYCCHLRVEIRPHDAFVLSHHVRTRFSAEQRARTIARVEKNLRRIAQLTPEQHIQANLPCAMLEDGVCSAYEARPATCRKYNSVSVENCRNAFLAPAAPLTGDIEHEQVRLAGNAVALGYSKGLEDAGYDTTLYELHFALHRALANPKAESRYRKGKRPFV
ncbi:MAG: YkgJ family cysteine cluster protein [Betaproteobacteria bacterium]